MKSRFRHVFPAAAVCAALLSVFVLHAADPAPKTDDSGWILPGANVGTGWHLRLKDARVEAAKDGKPILIVFSGPERGHEEKCGADRRNLEYGSET